MAICVLFQSSRFCARQLYHRAIRASNPVSKRHLFSTCRKVRSMFLEYRQKTYCTHSASLNLSLSITTIESALLGTSKPTSRHKNMRHQGYVYISTGQCALKRYCGRHSHPDQAQYHKKNMCMFQKIQHCSIVHNFHNTLMYTSLHTQ